MKTTFHKFQASETLFDVSPTETYEGYLDINCLFAALRSICVEHCILYNVNITI